MLSVIFPNCLSHIFFLSSDRENNLLADVSKVLPKFCNVIFFFSIGKIVSLGVPLWCMCIHMHVRFPFESQLVVRTQNQLIQALAIWLCASPSQAKTTVLELGNVRVPSPHKLPPLGVRGLWKSLGALSIGIRIRNVPAQIIHINNRNKNITLYIRLTATPRTKLTVYKNSYVKNLHKRQTERKSSVQTFTEKNKNKTKHNIWPIIMATKTCYCLQFHFIAWLEIIL